MYVSFFRTNLILAAPLLLWNVGQVVAFHGAFSSSRGMSLTKLGSTTTTSNFERSIEVVVGYKFTSSPMKVFIEDTDAYGVVYNANYLKFYDRALHHQTMRMSQSASSSSPASSAISSSSGVGGNLMDDIMLVGAASQKFRSSPMLGDEYVIEGLLTDIDDQGRQLWDFSMKRLDGRTTFHSAQGVLVTTRPGSIPLPEDVKPYTTKSSPNEAAFDSFTAYRDEFDPHSLSHLPLTSVLNHFERLRSNLLGGPKELKRLQEEDGIIFVVSKISDFYLLEHSRPNASLIGESLTVKTTSEVKRGGMVTDLYQTIYTSTGERMAQGVVTLMTLDRDTFRPTSKLPQRILDCLGGKRDTD